MYIVNSYLIAVIALVSALAGGVVFNLSNLLWIAAAAVAGMAVAFPIAVGLALVTDVVLNYFRRSLHEFDQLLFNN